MSRMRVEVGLAGRGRVSQESFLLLGFDCLWTMSGIKRPIEFDLLPFIRSSFRCRGVVGLVKRVWCGIIT